MTRAGQCPAGRSASARQPRYPNLASRRLPAEGAQRVRRPAGRPRPALPQPGCPRSPQLRAGRTLRRRVPRRRRRGPRHPHHRRLLKPAPPTHRWTRLRRPALKITPRYLTGPQRPLALRHPDPIALRLTTTFRYSSSGMPQTVDTRTRNAVVRVVQEFWASRLGPRHRALSRAGHTATVAVVRGRSTTRGQSSPLAVPMRHGQACARPAAHPGSIEGGRRGISSLMARG